MTRRQDASSRPAEIMRRFPKTLAALHAAEPQGAQRSGCHHCGSPTLTPPICARCAETLAEQGATDE